jgi:hypothetical protein
LIWPSRLSCTTNSGIISTDGIFFWRTRHSPRRLHEQVRIALRDGLDLAGRRRLELEVALVPDGERVDRLLARHLVERRVDDAALLKVDLALEVAVDEMEHARFSGDADELDDVREMELSE